MKNQRDANGNLWVEGIGQGKRESKVRAPESLNRDGAMALARRLQAYWHAQGYTAARFWAEPIGERFAKVGTYDIYRVVCNFVNGLPPRYRDGDG